MSSNYPHRTNEMLVPRNSPYYKSVDVGNQAVLNAANLGQHGFAANNFGYVNEEPYISERPYCVVLSTPAAFSDLPGGDIYHGVLRNFMETRTRKWSGVSSRTTTLYVDITWQGGQTLSAPSGASRQFGTISHEGLDLRGEQISTTFNIWQEYLLKDPVILHPKIITLNGGYTGDLLLDEISMACVYFEPDKTWKDVRRACVSLAMMIKDGPQFEMEYDVDSTAGKTRELSPEFTGLFEWNTYPAREIARNVMKRMPLYNPAGQGVPEGFGSPTATLESIKDNGLIEVMKKEASKVKNKDYMV